MTDKVFEGQYSGEKILLRTHPSLLFFILKNFSLILLYLCAAIVSITIGIFVKNFLIFGIILAVIFGFLSFFHIWHLYKNARYTFTSRRCIFYIKKSIFKRSYREIHITELRTAVPKKSGFFGMIGNYGTLILTDKDEKQIIYPGIKEHKNLSRYLGRIIDHIKINGHTDDFSVYVSEKIRKENKKS